MGLQIGSGLTDATYSPWRGCSEVSDGCRFCCAREAAAQNPKVLGEWGPDKPRVVGAPDYFNTPHKLNEKAKKDGRRMRLFCASFADFFEQFDGPMVDHKGVQLYQTMSGSWLPKPSTAEVGGEKLLMPPLTMDDVRLRVLTQITACRNVDWLILTKRANQILPTLRRLAGDRQNPIAANIARDWLEGSPPPNVWVGVSAENQQQLWLRAEHLRLVPAACRFISWEPALGPIDIKPWVDGQVERDRGYSFFKDRKSVV